jgi:RNA polymerase sigma-70 factor (ECF subfamily)
MAEVASGSRSAFSDVYGLMSGPVFGTIRKIVRDASIAEEVAHDVLVEVWTKAQAWEPTRGSAAAWILTIARRRAIDRVRREQASRDRDHAAAVRDTTTPHDAVTEEVIETEERVLVSAALDALTDLQRQSIELAYYGGKTQDEISTMLDVPLGTVKTRIRDGLLRLRTTLGGES